MEPISTVASICTLCGTAVALISTISEFIDAVHEAPTEVQALNNELASFYSSLGHIRVAVQEPRISDIPDTWTADFDRLLADCTATLAEVQILVDKARVTETTGSRRQLWKTIRFVFRAKQVALLRQRIGSQNGILQIMLATLTETRGAHLERRLEEIHAKVEELMLSRANVREVLVVLEADDAGADQADYTLSDRTSRHVPLLPEQPLTTEQSLALEGVGEQVGSAGDQVLTADHPPESLAPRKNRWGTRLRSVGLKLLLMTGKTVRFILPVLLGLAVAALFIPPCTDLGCYAAACQAYYDAAYREAYQKACPQTSSSSCKGTFIGGILVGMLITAVLFKRSYDAACRAHYEATNQAVEIKADWEGLGQGIGYSIIAGLTGIRQGLAG